MTETLLPEQEKTNNYIPLHCSKNTKLDSVLGSHYLLVAINKPGPAAVQMQKVLKETVLLPPLFCF